MLPLLQAAVLGSIQGITEFLPISSTAHLIIFERWFGLNNDIYGLSFDMLINLGTVLATAIYFWPTITRLLRDLYKPRSVPTGKQNLFSWSVLGVTLCAGIVGYLLEDTIATTFRSNTLLIPTSLIAVGALMIWADRRAEHRSGQPLWRRREVWIIGLSQIIAFIPGVSRSGITIVCGIFLGLNQVVAAELSFILSLPITSAAIFKRILTFLADNPSISSDVANFHAVGLPFSTIVGYFTIKELMRYLKRYPFRYFAYYRLALALVIVLWFV